MYSWEAMGIAFVCCLADSQVSEYDKDGRSLMLFDMPACHARPINRYFFTPHTNITSHINLTKGDFTFWCSGATRYHLVAVRENLIACATLVIFGQ